MHHHTNGAPHSSSSDSFGELYRPAAGSVSAATYWSAKIAPQTHLALSCVPTGPAQLSRTRGHTFSHGDRVAHVGDWARLRHNLDSVDSGIESMNDEKESVDATTTETELANSPQYASSSVLPVHRGSRSVDSHCRPNSMQVSSRIWLNTPVEPNTAPPQYSPNRRRTSWPPATRLRCSVYIVQVRSLMNHQCVIRINYSMYE